jgi:tRNA pseudouridine55 synthase
MRHGFLLVDKPEGPTSHDAVAIVRKTLGERSIGHLGTLDPLATGLLVLAVGKKALKVVELFASLSKEYVAEVTFGAVSSTYDREGVMEKIEPAPGVHPPTLEQLNRLIQDRFLGRLAQKPPAYSAITIGGERAYRKAMQGKAVDLPAREVLITACDLRSYDYPKLTLTIACGSGTYIRSFAHDLGQLVRLGAYLTALRRTKVGEWSIDTAKAPDRATWSDVIPLKEVMVSFPRVDLTSDEVEDITHGRMIERAVEPNTIGWYDELPIAIFKPAGEGWAHARKVL